MENENGKLQQELQDSKDQNELLEFRILELEVWALSLSTNQLHQQFICPYLNCDKVHTCNYKSVGNSDFNFVASIVLNAFVARRS